MKKKKELTDETIWTKFPLVTNLLAIFLVALSVKLAFDIRTYALQDYGYVIHEFDPWFNYRATEYLYNTSVKEFFQWYDHRSWFPLGRPVGTTIYPGMQITAVFLKHLFEDYGSSFPGGFELEKYTLNDVCCLMPCWFGVSSTLFTGLMAHEASRSVSVAAIASFLMAIIPAHIMRSVGGGYDNESVAVTAMTMTFYCYLRAIAHDRSIANSVVFGVLTGFAYIYMVAAWGGFIFVLNMISFHAFYLCFRSPHYSIFSKRENFSFRLSIAFSLFYVIGTVGAIQIPVVGLSPLKSLEQLFGMVAFLSCLSVGVCQGIRIYSIAPRVKAKRKAKKKKVLFVNEDEEVDEEYQKLLFKFIGFAGIVAAIVVALLYPTGYFGPLSARIRGLFVPHTRTGNPLVDSVAEHRSTQPSAYIRYLHACLLLTPIGFTITLFSKQYTKRNDQAMFLILYCFWAYYFSSKMVRLMILLGPIASILSAIAVDNMISWSYSQLLGKSKAETAVTDVKEDKKKKKKKKAKKEEQSDDLLMKELKQVYNENTMSRQLLAALLLFGLVYFTPGFVSFCHSMARRSSHPSIMFKVKNRLGQDLIIDDYREAYWWLRDNTPEDSRVLAWWDYGYQIAGIGDRITIADGNTWNHEHIATLGKCLVSPEAEGHEMISHLADYVLLWAGGGGDDLGKSPHIARIANSVYNEICGVDDPLCMKFSFKNRDRSQPLEMMEKSTIYRLYHEKQDKSRFELVYESKHKKVKIYRVLKVDMESRDYSFDPSNYICDESGWLCRGQYPPKFRRFMTTKKDFAQLENFNAEKSQDSAEYQKQYHKAFGKGGS